MNDLWQVDLIQLTNKSAIRLTNMVLVEVGSWLTRMRRLWLRTTDWRGSMIRWCCRTCNIDRHLLGYVRHIVVGFLNIRLMINWRLMGGMWMIWVWISQSIQWAIGLVDAYGSIGLMRWGRGDVGTNTYNLVDVMCVITVVNAFLWWIVLRWRCFCTAAFFDQFLIGHRLR